MATQEDINRYKQGLKAARDAGDTEAFNQIGAAIQKMEADLAVQNPPDREDPSDPSFVADPNDPYEYEGNTAKFIEDAMKVGSVEGASFLGAVAEAGIVDPIIAAVTSNEYPKGGLLNNFFNIFERNKKALLDIRDKSSVDAILADVSGEQFIPKGINERALMEADPTGGVLLSAVKAASDPLSYTGVTGAAKNLLARGVSAAGSGASGDIVATGGNQLEEALTDEEGTGIGALAGGILGSTVTSIPANAIAQYGINKAGSIVENIVAARSGKLKSEAAESAQSKAVYNYAQEASETMTPESVGKMVDDFKRFSSLVDIDEVPQFVAMANNPVTRTAILEIVNKNPKVRQQLQNEVDTILKAIDDKGTQLFGEAYKPVTQPKLNEEMQREAELGQARVNAIDKKISEFSSQVSSNQRTSESIGNAILNATKAKEKAVKRVMSPKYDLLKQNAKAEGVRMKPEGTSLIYNFVRENNLRDIFGKGTSLDKLIEKNFKYTTNVAGQRQYPPVSFSNIDSLKRAINAEKRKNLTPTEQRAIENLEEVVDKARNRYLPSKYNKALRNLDLEYYERVGVPFGQQGVVDIKSRKYAEQVAPIIANSPEKMKQFLKAVPTKEAITIARNTVLSKIAKASGVIDPQTGIVNQKALEVAINKNKDLIDVIPNLREEIEGVKKTGGDLLLLHQSALDRQSITNKAIADNQLLRIDSEVPNYYEMTKKLFGGTDRKYLNETMNKINQLDPATGEAVLDRLRAQVLSVATDSSKGAFKFLTNPNNAIPLKKVFDEQYIEDIKGMAQLMDAAKKADLSRGDLNIDASVRGDIERGTGIPSSEFVSRFRNQIRSKFHSALELGTKSLAFLGKQEGNKALLVELMKPLSASRLNNFAKTVKDKNNMTSQEIGKLMQILKSSAPAFFMIGAKSGASVQEQENQPTQQQLQAGQQSTMQ